MLRATDPLLKLECTYESLGDQVKMQTLTRSQPVALKFCFSNRLPGGAVATAERTLTSQGSQQSVQKYVVVVVKSWFLPFRHDVLYSSASAI